MILDSPSVNTSLSKTSIQPKTASLNISMTYLIFSCLPPTTFMYLFPNRTTPYSFNPSRFMNTEYETIKPDVSPKLNLKIITYMKNYNSFYLMVNVFIVIITKWALLALSHLIFLLLSPFNK